VSWHEGDVIRKARTLLGWTLEDLAERSGVNFSVINRIELGKTKEPKRATLAKIARAFGWTPRQILEAVPAQGFAIDLSIRKRTEPSRLRENAHETALRKRGRST
jgi:Predicted transcriptional regulator with C-terminal CBS domains